MATAEASIRFDVTPETAYGVITDIQRYPDFLSEVESIAVSRVGKERWRADYVIKMIKRISYTLELAGTPHTGLSWTMLSGGGPMKKNEGRWILSEGPGGTTEARYQVDITFGRLVPKRIQTRLTQASLPGMLRTFKRRIETLSGVSS